MLKITTHIDIDAGLTVFSLEGRLAGPWVAELERCWRTVPSTRATHRLRVDLTGVTHVDNEGKILLVRMHQDGADLIAAGCLTKCIVDEIMREGPYDQAEPCGGEPRPASGRRTPEKGT